MVVITIIYYPLAEVSMLIFIVGLQRQVGMVMVLKQRRFTLSFSIISFVTMK